MRKNKAIISIEEFLFFGYFLSMLLMKGLGFVDGPIYKVSLVTSGIFFLLKLIVSRLTAEECLINILLLVLCGLIWIANRNQAPIICCMMVLSMKHMDIRKVFTAGAVGWGFAYIFQFFTHMIGLGQHDFVIHSKLGLGYLIRWGFGYSHPNVLQIAYTILIIYIFYAFYKGKNLLRWCLVAIVFGTYVFLYSVSMTGILSLLAFLIFLVYFETNRKLGRSRTFPENGLLELLFPLEVMASVCAPVLLKGRAFDLLNKALTTRPALTQWFLNNYGLSLFGFDFSGLYSGYTLDCSYANLLMNGGCVLFLILMIGYFLAIHIALREKASCENSIRLAMLFCITFTAMSEPFAFNTSFKNVSLFLIGYYLYRWTETKHRESIQFLRHIASCGDKNMVIPLVLPQMDIIRNAMMSMKKRKGLFIAGIMMAGILAAGICAACINMPSQIYALRSDCDTDDSSINVYLSEEEVHEYREDSNVWVLSYQSEKDPLLCFEGNIVKVEYIRDIISAFLWTACAMMCMMVVIIGRKTKGIEQKGLQ